MRSDRVCSGDAGNIHREESLVDAPFKEKLERGFWFWICSDNVVLSKLSSVATIN